MLHIRGIGDFTEHLRRVLIFLGRQRLGKSGKDDGAQNFAIAPAIGGAGAQRDRTIGPAAVGRDVAVPSLGDAGALIGVAVTVAAAEPDIGSSNSRIDSGQDARQILVERCDIAVTLKRTPVGKGTRP
jgi:hypothetical protein